ncbi:MAG: hypothetical protein WCY32_00820 [Burkholderiaceae bacterium]
MAAYRMAPHRDGATAMSAAAQSGQASGRDGAGRPGEGAAQPRIWLAVDALERSEIPLGAALALARLLRAELSALFVENIDLFRVAAFPQTFEMRLFGARSGGLSADELEHVLRAQARAVRRQLDQAALASGVRWQFETARGRIVQQALDRAGAADWVVVPGLAVATALALGQRRPPGASGRTAGIRSGLPREIWAVPGAGPDGWRALERGRQLLQGRGRVLMPAEPAAAEALRQGLRERGWQDLWREASLQDLQRVRSAPGGADAGLLLLPRPVDAVQRAQLEALWRRAGWPLLLL